MNFDVYYLDPETSEPDGFAEYLCNFSEFLNLARILAAFVPFASKVSKEAADEGGQQMLRVLEWYDEIAHEGGEAAAERFDAICTFANDHADQLAEEESEPQALGIRGPVRVDPGLFPDHVRQFLGEMLLGESPVSPKRAAGLLWFARGSLGVMSGIIDEYNRQGEHEMVAAFEAAAETLGILAEVAERSTRDEQPFLVTC